nr:hypothetical protein [uncultured Porphyromonas sp.]
MKQYLSVVLATVALMSLLAPSCKSDRRNDPIPPSPQPVPTPTPQPSKAKVKTLTIEAYKEGKLAQRTTASFSEQGWLLEYIRIQITTAGEHKLQQHTTRAYDVYGNILERMEHHDTSPLVGRTVLYTYDYTQDTRGRLIKEEFMDGPRGYTTYEWQDGRISRSETFRFGSDSRPDLWSEYHYVGNKVIRYNHKAVLRGYLPPDTIISQYDVVGRLMEEDRAITNYDGSFINGKYGWTVSRTTRSMVYDSTSLAHLEPYSITEQHYDEHGQLKQEVRREYLSQKLNQYGDPVERLYKQYTVKGGVQTVEEQYTQQITYIYY